MLAATGERAAPGDDAPPEERGGGRVARWLARAAPHAPAIAAAVAGLAWLFHHVGASILVPTRIAWVMAGDWAAGYLGWAFFRDAPFALPLGTNPGYPYPVGSTVAASDSIPIVAILLRPLSGVLPDDFQFIGAWLAIAFALQGFVGAKLVKLVTPSALAQALGGALFAVAPPLIHRVVGPNTGHASLSAHWLVLAFLWLALAPVEPGRVRPRLAAAGALLAVASGVHPYHLAAGVAISLALILRLRLVDRVLGWRGAAAGAAGVLAIAAAGLWLFGYLASGTATPTAGFGSYSADLLFLVNPIHWSRLWRGFAFGRGQYEGFGYLGAGGLALVAAAAVALAVRPRAVSGARWRAALPALGAALVLAAYALSDTITVAGRKVAHVPVYDWIPFVGSTFRSSGRFVWSLHYLVLLAAIAALARAGRQRPIAVAAGLAAALALQALDVRPPIPIVRDRDWGRPRSDVWETARGAYRHVAMVPPYLVANGGQVAPEPWGCDRVWTWDAQVPPADVARRLSATFNSGYLGRLEAGPAVASCVEQRAALAAGRLDPETIHVVHPRYLPLLAAARATCGIVDALLVCVDGARRDPFSDALRRSLR
ncbi:MAG TPA: DUF6311 domain-containing protein [Anaeromyxobacter sp.]|nr:DUF6311 domain-containing protein [Anaeromyxobacter sp.]